MHDNTSAPEDSSVKIASSTLISRNITVCNHRTSVRLEPGMWQGLMEICRRERASMHEVCSAVSMAKGKSTSLTAAIRVFIMAYYRMAATEEGHTKAGHGQNLTQAMSAPMLQAMLTSAMSTQPSPSNFMIGMPLHRGMRVMS